MPGLAVRAGFAAAGFAGLAAFAAAGFAGAETAREARLGVGALPLSVTARSLAWTDRRRSEKHPARPAARRPPPPADDQYCSHSAERSGQVRLGSAHEPYAWTVKRCRWPYSTTKIGSMSRLDVSGA